MPIDPQQAKDTFGWAGVVLFIILALFGAGSIGAILIKALIERYWGKKDKAQDKRDKRDDVREANQASQLEADGAFRDSLIIRVEKLETKLEAMQKEQLSQAITNERLSTENTYLKEDKNRQERELTDLKGRNRILNDKVTDLSRLVHKLEVRISELTGQPIDVRLVQPGDE